jgi:hypothetical protein
MFLLEEIMDTPTEKKSATATEKQKASRTRSPAYPGISLETAINRARALYAADKMNAVPLVIAVKRWGFGEKSSGGLVNVAALKSFGLLKDSGSGKDRKVQLTEEARRIILDQRQESPERDEAIKRAALLPKMHAALWNKWKADLPADDTLRHALAVDWFFNLDSIPGFIKEYKDTILFAKLTDSDTLSAGQEDIEEESEMAASDVRSAKETPTDWLPHQDSGLPQRAKPTPIAPKEISMPVGLSEDGQPVFAHVRFDAPLKKEFLESLRGLLQALEKGLA